jgi:lipid-binding SYLF domain-containing protein
MKRRNLLGVLVGLMGLLSLPVVAAEGDDGHKDRPVTEKEVAAAIELFRDKDPSLKKFFDTAHAYAIFPNVGKGAFFVGGAHGMGAVYRKGRRLGDAVLNQVSVGFQFGGQSFSELVFFKNKEAFDQFKKGDYEFSAQASAVAATTGAAAANNYTHGVAVFTLAKGGLMVEAAVGGQRFRYLPKR